MTPRVNKIKILGIVKGYRVQTRSQSRPQGQQFFFANQMNDFFYHRFYLLKLNFHTRQSLV